MDAETCCLCHKNPPKYGCSCVFPALPICAACLDIHLESEQNHMPTLIRKQSRKAPTVSENEVCDECRSTSAVLFCLCGTPFRKFCEKCDYTHYAKAPEKVHFKHPMTAYQAVASGAVSIEKFRKKQTYVDHIQFRLQENLAQFDGFIRKVEEDFDALIQSCMEKKESSLQELIDQRRKLVEALNEAQQIISAKRYLEEFDPTSWLEGLLLDGHISNPNPDIQLFSANVSFGNAADMISKSVTSELNLESLKKGVVQTIPVIKGNRLWLIDSVNLSKTETTLSLSTNINNSTAYCYIGLHTLLCCGGDTHAEVYEINVKTNNAIKVNSMSTTRRYSGIWKYRDSAFVFGGVDLQSAEKYSLSTKNWAAVRGSLVTPQYAITVCEHTTGAYLSGVNGSNIIIEVFNPETETFKQLQCSGVGRGYWPLLFCVSNDLHWVHVDSIDMVMISSENSYNTIAISKIISVVGNGHYWSNFYLKLLGNEFIGVINPGGAPSGLFKYISASNQFSQVLNFSY